MSVINTVIYDLGKITDWLSSIGTIGAVVTALYLAKKDRKPKAKVKSSVGYGVYGPEITEHPIQISLEIVNQGLMPIALKECTLDYQKDKKMIFPEGHHQVNKLLGPGEHYEHVIPFEPLAKFLLSEKKEQLKTNFYFLDASGNKYKTKINLSL